MIATILFSGCQAKAMNKNWHEKHGWKAAKFFSDFKVIELCNAIEANDLVSMRKLIDAGADVNSKGIGNMTPLLWAFPDNKPERFRLLLENGANPNVTITSNFGVPDGFLVGDCVTHMSCKTHFSYLEDVFNHGGDPNLPSQIETNKNETPIFFVIRTGGEDAKKRIEILLKKGADINHCVNVTPLILSAYHGGQYELAMFLIESGADIHAYQDNGVNKLTHALVKAEKTLLKNASPQQRADYGKLVMYLERNGESLEEARSDLKRWEEWNGSLRELYQREKEERLEREKNK
jgi:ankyrin repeat protein